ncbi:MAG: Rieske (2Fe-2S) protein [Candidatus Kapabacteria bacterium]|nr:Rieske (2Fe-2S) protein [Candidatus Kapabacteria bacterium]
MNTPQSRQEFISLCALSVAGLCTASVLPSCRTSPIATTPSDTDTLLMSIDLSQPAYSALRVAGGYMVIRNILIIRYSDVRVIARSAFCTHEGQELIWDSALSMIRCPRHGARYLPDGVVIQGPASDNLIQYRAVLSGDSITVYGR